MYKEKHTKFWAKSWLMSYFIAVVIVHLYFFMRKCTFKLHFYTFRLRIVDDHAMMHHANTVLFSTWETVRHVHRQCFHGGGSTYSGQVVHNVPIARARSSRTHMSRARAYIRALKNCIRMRRWYRGVFVRISAAGKRPSVHVINLINVATYFRRSWSGRACC